MHPHLHMLASFALVDLARQAQVGAQLYKQAELGSIPGEVGDKIQGYAEKLLPHLSNLGKAVPESLGDFAEGGAGLLESGIRGGLGFEPNNFSFNTNPLATLSENMGSIEGAQGALSKVAPGIGALGGGLLGAGLGGGAAKLLQGTPEDEEEAKANRTNMILAALAGGGLGALGGSAASLQPIVKEKLHDLGQNPGVRGALETGSAAYGNVVTKIKDLITKLMAAKGGGGGAPAGGGGSSYNPPGPSPQELLGLGQ